MHQRLKERLVGAAVFVFIAVVFIPMLLTGPVDSGAITKTNIPDRPTEKFNSKLIPLYDSLKSITETEIENPMVGLISGNEKVINSVGEKAVDEIKDSESGKSSLNNDKKTANKGSVQKKNVTDKQIGLTAWVVQLGNFENEINANKLNLSLRKSGFPAFVEPSTIKGKTSYRVRVGPEILRTDADVLLKKIKTKMKLDGIVLNYP